MWALFLVSHNPNFYSIWFFQEGLQPKNFEMVHPFLALSIVLIALRQCSLAASFRLPEFQSKEPFTIQIFRANVKKLQDETRTVQPDDSTLHHNPGHQRTQHKFPASREIENMLEEECTVTKRSISELPLLIEGVHADFISLILHSNCEKLHLSHPIKIQEQCLAIAKGLPSITHDMQDKRCRNTNEVFMAGRGGNSLGLQLKQRLPERNSSKCAT